MDANLFPGLIGNAALLLALGLLYDMLGVRRTGRPRPAWWQQVGVGVVLAAMGLAVMKSSVVLETGLVFDTRSILLSIAGLFFGTIPALMAMAATAAVRFDMGGPGMRMGVAVIVESVALGLAWRYVRRQRVSRMSVGELYLFGIAVHVGMLLCTLLLPAGKSLSTLRNIALPVMLIYPVGTALLGRLLVSRHARHEAERVLQESESRYRSLFENNHAAMMLVDPATAAVVDANPAACAYYGWTREEMRGKPIDAINTMPMDRIREMMGKAQTADRRQFEFRHRCADGSIRDVEVYSGPITMEGRTLLYSLVFDIRLRKEAEKRIEELNAALEGRIEALTQPEADVSTLRLEDIFDLREIQKIQDVFAAATGVASIITEVDGTPITRPSNFCRLCEDIIRKTPKGFENCCRSDAIIGRPNSDGAVMQPCLSGGLWDGGASIRVGDHHIANWLIGQVLEEPFDEEKMVAYAREIGADAGEFRSALAEVTRMPRAQFAKVCDALYQIANQLSSLAVRNVQQARLISNLRRAEDALRQKTEELEGYFNQSLDLLCIADTDGHFRRLNPEWAKVLGYRIEDLEGMNFFDLIHPDDIEATKQAVAELASDREVFNFLNRYRAKDGSYRWIEWRSRPTRQTIYAAARDVTDRIRAEEERLQLERQILQTQKLESLGVLAGGIAHDFNNILMAVLGHADIALQDLPPGAPARQSLHEIERASRRAADLCRQMLAYSGKGRFVIENINLRELIEEMVHLIRTSISKKAVLHLDLKHELPPISGDATQIRQIILNLVINASEAIGDRSGSITITAKALACSAEYLAEAYLDENLPAGDYVCLQVSDTGCGMDAETVSRIFEPFFTTKFTGRGLGMSAVLGIVRGHKGALKVYSEPGRGTTFKILLPASEAQPAKPADVAAPERAWRGGGNVLLVDDETTIRDLGRRMLERIGFRVITASNGREAIEIFRERHEDIRAVLLDLTMPHMNGEEAFREMRRIDPGVRVVVSSGYTETDVSARFAGKGIAGFIQKPYTMDVLRTTLNKVFMNFEKKEGE